MSGAHRVTIQLTVLGGLHARADDGELDWLLSQRLRAAVFVYLAVERQVSREALTALFWPESDTENARHALRQCLYQLRKALGGKWLERRTHELRVSPLVRTDVHDFAAARECADAESAARLCRGAFLDGVHLVDVQPWESWVDARRAQYARAFRRACRDWLEARRGAGDVAGAVAAAEWWVARDPADDEAQHRLIQTLAEAGERAEAIRQYEAYARLLHTDGLRPLEETVKLVTQLRAQPGAPPVPFSPPPPTDVPAVDPLQPATPPLSDSLAKPVTSRQTRVARSRLPLAAVITLAIVLGAVWRWKGSRGAPVQPTSPAAIAVLPFSIHGGDEARYLADGMVTLLTTALDGAASVTPVDSRAVHAAVTQGSAASLDRVAGSRIATKLDAAWFVLGDIVLANDRLQIDAGVYERDRSIEPVAHASVAGTAGELFDLVDRLAAHLLSELGDVSADRLLRSAAVTTASLPAFKAYLQGETLMRAGEFERAAESYLDAIAHDSAFGLAFYRLALAREWAPLPGNEAAARAAAQHAERLSAHDRNLLAAHRAWRAGEASAAEHAFRAILAHYPHDVEAWIQLGEVMFHHGPLLGRSFDESEIAWRKVLSFEPRNLFAVPHLARIAAATGRVAALDSLLAPFTREIRETDRRLVEIGLLRALAEHDTVKTLQAAGEMRRWEDLSLWRVAVFVTAFTPNPAATARAIAGLLGEHRAPAVRADLLWITSILYLASGQISAARTALQEAAAVEAAIPQERRRDAFSPITEWYAATLPLPYADSMLDRVRSHAERVSASQGSSTRVFGNELGIGESLRVEPLRQYTLGMISLRLKDLASAKIAAEALRRIALAADANVIERDLDRGLRAALASFEGHNEQALSLLETLELRDTQGDIAVTPFASRAHERFLHGELLIALGRDTEALQWFGSLGTGSVTEIPLKALSHLRQAEIHERLGNHRQAAIHYDKFVGLWSRADAEFQPMVETARHRLIRQ
jgi:DNA-binding SARP family transcriptional activator/tetratricopeptide (TPR) repeat protein